MRLRHTLATVLFATGCYAHHELEHDSDGGTCGLEPTFVEGLFCPEEVFFAGEMARVEFHHRVGVCCESGSSTVGVGSTGRGEFSVTASWVACGCNELLDCLGPQEESVVEVGPLIEGTNVVRAGPFECELQAEAPSECSAVDAGFIAPRVLFDDQAFATSLQWEEPADCLCTPEVTAGRREIDLRLCGCEDFCDASFASYSGSWVGDTHEAGNLSYRIGGTEHPLTVVPLDPPLTPGAGCRRIEPTALEFVQPTGNHAGPRLVWAGLTGEQSLCCSPELLLAARTLASDRRAIGLELYTCIVEDCWCGVLPPPTVATAWHNLGDLAPGEYIVRAGSIIETISVF